MEILSAALPAEKVRTAQGCADPGRGMGAVASAVGFLLLCDAG